ncbi:hypothetical protein [Endozoicomonas sp. SESOKO1]|uniref:hypothetical protein n=1 Tax=Endozoicomonas sp. SESOKO1 TaxID=2828742 RepID=UPI0021471FA2|nr:hypothetical protein [Endozoicomonas sp. SESOKO1]
MDTTSKHVSFASIPLQSRNEEQTASSENTEGSFSTSNGRICVAIGLGVAIVGSMALGLGLTRGKQSSQQLTTNSPTPGPENTQALNGRNITVSNTIHPSTQQFIADSITTTPNITVATPHASWLPPFNNETTSTAFQGTSTPANNTGRG